MQSPLLQVLPLLCLCKEALQRAHTLTSAGSNIRCCRLLCLVGAHSVHRCCLMLLLLLGRLRCCLLLVCSSALLSVSRLAVLLLLLVARRLLLGLACGSLLLLVLLLLAVVLRVVLLLVWPVVPVVLLLVAVVPMVAMPMLLVALLACLAAGLAALSLQQWTDKAAAGTAQRTTRGSGQPPKRNKRAPALQRTPPTRTAGSSCKTCSLHGSRPPVQCRPLLAGALVWCCPIPPSLCVVNACRLTSCAAALRRACSSLKHSRFLKGPSSSSFS